MNDKKHIDRLFQERFKDFEATPSDAVWQHIEAELTKEKKKRRVIPIWWQYAGVAALLALLLTVGGTYFIGKNSVNPINVVDMESNQARTSNSENNIKIAVENNTLSEKKLEKDSQKDVNVVSKRAGVSKPSNVVNTSQVASTSEENYNIKTSTTSNKTSNLKNNLGAPKNNTIVSTSEEKNKALNNSAIINYTENNDKTLQNNETLINSEKAKNLINNTTKDTTDIAKAEDKNNNSLTIEEALEDSKNNIEKEKNTNKWRITPNAAPVYFNSLGEGSAIDSQFNTNSKTGEVNMSYGISASYVINDKLKIRSGIHKVNLGYNTNDVVQYQSVGISSNIRSLEHVTASIGKTPDNISVISSETLNVKPEAFATINTSINQAFAYIEVPLEIQYALVNTKLGINLIGGFSSFFLSDNTIFSEAENGTKLFLGEANNINNVSYSANFGVGFNYQISKKIDLNLEPMFKYQINTFNNTSGNFTPYFIGIYTGFAFKF